MKKLMICASLLVMIAGCATRSPLLSTPAVSMTQDSVPKGSTAKNLGPVTSRYCYGDEATTRKGDTVGLMDEVIMKAQEEKKASYIANANFSYEGTSCIVLEGDAMKVQ